MNRADKQYFEKILKPYHLASVPTEDREESHRYQTILGNIQKEVVFTKDGFLRIRMFDVKSGRTYFDTGFKKDYMYNQVEIEEAFTAMEAASGQLSTCL